LAGLRRRDAVRNRQLHGFGGEIDAARLRPRAVGDGRYRPHRALLQSLERLVGQRLAPLEHDHDGGLAEDVGRRKELREPFGIGARSANAYDRGGRLRFIGAGLVFSFSRHVRSR
jgi:hypothetical protein